MSIEVKNLAAAISKELSEYSAEITENLKKDVKDVAEEAAKELKRISPAKSGDYAKGWKYKIVYEGVDDIRAAVYNAKKPQLTHLLENGHAKVTGGRTQGIPHISVALEHAEEKLDKGIKVISK